MAGVAKERIESRTGSLTLNTKDSTRVFVVTGEINPDEALKLGPAISAPHPDDGNMLVVKKTIKHIEGANDTCELHVLYTLPDQSPASRQEFDKELSFDTTSQTVHIDKVLDDASGDPQQTWYTIFDGDQKSGNDLLGLIGTSYELNSEPKGVDVYAPTYTHVETWWLPSVSDAYKQTLFELSGKINNSHFKGFSEGEMLFLGAVGSRRGYGLWRVTYRFLAIKNREKFKAYTVNGEVEIPLKEGWEYLWGKNNVVEADVLGGGGEKEMVKGPEDIYVGTVYEKANFGAIGIGT